MKIKEFAFKKGVTRAAIYNMITRNGLSTKQITDKQGEITEQGQRILESLFLPQEEPIRAADLETIKAELSESQEKLRAAEAERDSLREQLTEAQGRAEKWERLYLDLQDRAAQEREQYADRERETKLLLAQQMELNRYLAMNPIKRLFSGRSKKAVEAEGEIK